MRHKHGQARTMHNARQSVRNMPIMCQMQVQIDHAGFVGVVNWIKRDSFVETLLLTSSFCMPYNLHTLTESLYRIYIEVLIQVSTIWWSRLYEQSRGVKVGITRKLRLKYYTPVEASKSDHIANAEEIHWNTQTNQQRLHTLHLICLWRSDTY